MSTRRYFFDVRFARPGALDGVGRFLWNIAGALGSEGALDVDRERVTCLCADDDVDLWRTQLGPLWKGGVVDVRGTDLPIASVAQHGAWPKLVEQSGAHVAHYPQYDMPRVPHGVAAVSTVHDFTPVDEPRYFETAAVASRSSSVAGSVRRDARRLAAAAFVAGVCARSTIITTLSRAVADEVERRAPRAHGRVHVVTPGPPVLEASTTTSPTRDESRAMRFVYVGNHRPHKRVELLVHAFARARRELAALSCELVLVGRVDPRFPDVARLVAPGTALSDGVTLVTDVDDAQLASLLRTSRALVFASVGEGYGFPVVEALAAGTPAIVADAGSLPEVLGGAGLVVPADDVDAWSAALVRMACDDDLWQRARKRASEVVAGLSWDRAARDLVQAWRAADAAMHRDDALDALGSTRKHRS